MIDGLSVAQLLREGYAVHFCPRCRRSKGRERPKGKPVEPWETCCGHCADEGVEVWHDAVEPAK